MFSAMFRDYIQYENADLKNQTLVTAAILLKDSVQMEPLVFPVNDQRIF